MIQVSIDKDQLNERIKSVTRASDEEWGAAWKSMVMTLVKAYCFTYAGVQHLRAIWNNPRAYWEMYTAEAVAAPVKAPPTKKKPPKPKPVAKATSPKAEVITLKTPAPKKVRRARKAPEKQMGFA